MTLSFLLIFILACSIIPAIFLPANKIKTYVISSSAGFVVSFFLFFMCLNFSLFEYSLGKGVYPMFAFILNGNKDFSFIEKYHISSFLFITFLYVILYIISYIITKIFYIGTNPNIHKATSVIFNVFLSTIFTIFTGVFISIILIEIRQLLPISDGFLSAIFQTFYKIEA